MNKVAEYIGRLGDDTKIQIVRDFEQFERDGMIGDLPLRQHAEALCQELGIASPGIAMWMNMVAFECYREFGERYIALLGRK